MDNKAKELLLYIANSETSISRSEVCNKFKISEATASRWLDFLYLNGEIERYGAGRSTVYSVDNADQYLINKQKNGFNLPINYDFDRLDAYVDGVSSFFTKKQKEDLIKASSVPTGFTHPDYISSIQRKLLLEASWSSSVLEGNTYSLVDTEDLFDFGREKIGSKAEESLMLLNHKDAIEYIIDNINKIKISRIDILNVHALLSNGLLKDPADSGRVRFHPVSVGQSTYKPIDVNSVLSEQLDKLIDKSNNIKDVFDKSFYLLINVAYLQPFSDVNKRTSRMVCNIPLLKNSMIPMSFFQLSKTGYEKGIIHYYEAGDFKRLAKEFVTCYLSSSARFRELLDNKPLPEEIRLKGLYRKDIAICIRHIVQNKADIESAYFECMPKSINEKEKIFLLSFIEKALDGLSESNAILYGISEEDVNEYTLVKKKKFKV